MVGNTRTNRKEYKRKLERKGLIKCGRCPYNRKENANRIPKSDIGKNPRRTR